MRKEETNPGCRRMHESHWEWGSSLSVKEEARPLWSAMLRVQVRQTFKAVFSSWSKLSPTDTHGKATTSLVKAEQSQPPSLMKTLPRMPMAAERESKSMDRQKAALKRGGGSCCSSVYLLLYCNCYVTQSSSDQSGNQLPKLRH